MFRRWFLHQMRPIQLSFLVLFYVGYSPPPWPKQHFLTSHTIGPSELHPSPAPHLETFEDTIKFTDT